MAGVGVEMLGKPVQDARINVSRRKQFRIRGMRRFVINPRSSTTFPINYTLVAFRFSRLVDIPFSRR
jgi:hypothetical protein